MQETTSTSALGVGKPPLKRLLHLSGYAIRGGCETSCATLIENAPHFAHDVVVFGKPGPMSEVWQRLGASVSHLDVLEKSYVAFLLRLDAELRAQAYAGVFLWSGIRSPLVLALVARLHYPVVLYGGNPFERRPRIDLMLAICEHLLPRPQIATIVPCSEHVRRSLVAAPYFRRLPSHVCLNPIAVPARNEHVARLLDPSMPMRIGMVARLDPIKDHATVLRAFALVKGRWTEAELHLAGDGSLASPSRDWPKSLALPTVSVFLGSIANVPEFLKSLDLFVYGTTEAEGMGSALAEAVSYGLPCVVTDLAAMREVVGDESLARLCAPQDAGAFARAIADLLADQSVRAVLSERSHQRAKRVFDARTITGDYLRLLGLSAT